MDFDSLTETTVNFALSRGLLHGELIDNKQYFTHMPVSLFPFPICESNFKDGLNLNLLFGELVAWICRNPDFLFEQLKDITDDFTCNLIRIAKKAIVSPYYQTTILGLLRSDYMIENENGSSNNRMLQIELNTISCSFPGSEELLTKLHQNVLLDGLSDLESISKFMNVSMKDITNYVQDKHFNESGEGACKGIADTVAYYNDFYNRSNTIVLVVNQENENNRVDQVLLTLRLSEQYSIQSMYQTHTQLQDTMRIVDGVMYVNDREVSVVYYRSGYTPSDYPTKAQWMIREEIECSLAIKCPNVLLHLTGCKKIQQQLALPGIVERILTDDVKSSSLRSCFTAMYPAECIVNDEYCDVLTDVITSPSKYVLKPQREGGGHNIWGNEIVETLQRRDMNELSSLILMERIFPKEADVCHIRESKSRVIPSLSEIGFYSILLFDTKKNEMMFDRDIGILVRTKSADSLEGGVSAGFAVMNSPIVTSLLCCVCY